MKASILLVRHCTHRLVQIFVFDSDVAVNDVEADEQSCDHNGLVLQHDGARLVQIPAKKTDIPLQHRRAVDCVSPVKDNFEVVSAHLQMTCDTVVWNGERGTKENEFSTNERSRVHQHVVLLLDQNLEVIGETLLHQSEVQPRASVPQRRPAKHRQT